MDKKTNDNARKRQQPGTDWLQGVVDNYLPLESQLATEKDPSKGILIIAIDGEHATIAATGSTDALATATKIVLSGHEPFDEYLPLAARMIADEMKDANTPVLTIPLTNCDEEEEVEIEEEEPQVWEKQPRNYARPEWISSIGADVEEILNSYDFDDDKACIFIALDHQVDHASYCHDTRGGNRALAEAVGRLVYEAGIPGGDFPFVIHSAARAALRKFDEAHPELSTWYKVEEELEGEEEDN